MSTRTYRSILLGCTLSWFLVGLHVPALHAMVSHGRTPQWTVVGVVAGLAIAAVVGLGTLLFAPPSAAGGAAGSSDG